MYVSGIAYFYYGVFFVVRNLGTIILCSLIKESNLRQLMVRAGFSLIDIYGVTCLLTISGASLLGKKEELECLGADQVQKWWLAVCVLSGIYLGYLLLIITTLLVLLDLVLQFRIRLNTLGREFAWCWLDARYNKIPFAKEFFHKIRQLYFKHHDVTDVCKICDKKIKDHEDV